MDHQLLLAKLEHHRVRGEALDLLGSFLEERAQYGVYVVNEMHIMIRFSIW